MLMTSKRHTLIEEKRWFVVLHGERPRSGIAARSLRNSHTCYWFAVHGEARWRTIYTVLSFLHGMAWLDVGLWTFLRCARAL